jgi:hypothetical protein
MSSQFTPAAESSELTTIFDIAIKDPDPNVQHEATEGLLRILEDGNVAALPLLLIFLNRVVYRQTSRGDL